MSHAAITRSYRTHPHDWSYFASCIEWPSRDVHRDGGLIDMIDRAREVSRKIFCRSVRREDREELEAQLGYARHPQEGLTMKGDFHVRYYRSRLHGWPVYYLTHSSIEYVFVPPEFLTRHAH
jgi:hypothetical protein